MREELRLTRTLVIYPLIQFLLIILWKLQWVSSTTDIITSEKKMNNHSCYTCVEPLVGYS